MPSSYLIYMDKQHPVTCYNIKTYFLEFISGPLRKLQADWQLSTIVAGMQCASLGSEVLRDRGTMGVLD